MKPAGLVAGRRIERLSAEAKSAVLTFTPSRDISEKDAEELIDEPANKGNNKEDKRQPDIYHYSHNCRTNNKKWRSDCKPDEHIHTILNCIRVICQPVDK